MSGRSETHKTIDVNELKPGMFVERLDRSWLTTPFVRHRFLLRDEQDIALLRHYGIRRVVIDTAKTVDLSDQGSAHPKEASNNGESSPTDASASDDSPKTPPSTAPPSREEVKIARLLHAEATSALERMFVGTTTPVRIDNPALRSMVSHLGERITTQRNAMLAAVRLQQLQRFDHNLFSHVVDVTVLSMAVAIEQGLDSRALEDMALGALLHDIGEMRLPRNLLRKTSRYADHERDLMMHHPALGVAMLNDPGLPEIVRRIVGEHHERVDGSGYPAKLRGDAIAAESQLVGLIDIYDALVTTRGGRPAIPPPQAIRRIYQLGLNRQFDTRLVEQVVQTLGVYPIGSLVELNTGERAVVVAVNPALSLKPSLKLITDRQGRLYTEPLLLELSVPEHAGSARAILRDLDPDKEQYDTSLCLAGVA